MQKNNGVEKDFKSKNKLTKNLRYLKMFTHNNNLFLITIRKGNKNKQNDC